jgi:hypothetical protein
MSREPGRIQRAVEALFRSKPDVAHTTGGIRNRVYRDTHVPPSLQHVARAAKQFCVATGDWTWERARGRLFFINLLSEASRRDFEMRAGPSRAVEAAADVEAFVAECCEVVEGAWVETDKLLEAYDLGLGSWSDPDGQVRAPRVAEGGDRVHNRRGGVSRAPVAVNPLLYCLRLQYLCVPGNPVRARTSRTTSGQHSHVDKSVRHSVTQDLCARGRFPDRDK